MSIMPLPDIALGTSAASCSSPFNQFSDIEKLPSAFDTDAEGSRKQSCESNVEITARTLASEAMLETVDHPLFNSIHELHLNRSESDQAGSQSYEGRRKYHYFDAVGEPASNPNEYHPKPMNSHGNLAFAAHQRIGPFFTPEMEIGIKMPETELSQRYQPNRRQRKWTLAHFASLILINLTCGLAVTSLSTALPAIERSLGVTTALTIWVPGSFLLAASLLQPLFMRLSYVTGCRPLLAFGTLTFAVASISSTLWSNSITEVLIYRSLAGIGSSISRALTPLISAQLASGERQNLYQRWASLSFWVGASIGPLLGSLVLNYSTWKCIFLMEGLCSIGSFVFLPFLHLPASKIKAKKLTFKVFDYINWALLAVSILLTAAATTGAAFTGHWLSTHTWAPLIAGLIGLALWSLSVGSIDEPIVPVSLLRSLDAATACFGAFVQNLLFAAIMYLMPLYFGIIHGWSTVNIGLYVTVWSLMVPLASFAVISIHGTWISPASFGGTKYLVALMWAGIILGMWQTARFEVASFQTLVALAAGLGMGLLTPVLCTIVQHAASNDDEIIHALPLFNFFGSLGQSYGVIVSIAIFVSRLEQAFPLSSELGGDWSLNINLDVAQLSLLTPGPLAEEIRGNYVNAFSTTWITMLGAAVVACIASLCLLQKRSI